MMLTVHTDADRSSRRQLLSSSSSSPPAEVSQVARPKKRTGMLAVAAVVGVAAIVGVSVRATRSDAKSTQAIAPPAVATTEQVAVNITAVPSTAKISVDGVQVFAPYEAKIDRSTTSHTVLIEADGFEPQTKTVVFDRNLSLSVALNKSTIDHPAAGTASIAARTQPTVVAQFTPRVTAPTPVKTTTEAPRPTAVVSAPPAGTPDTTATSTGKPKKDIDRGNPFANGTGTVKAIDKSSPFNK